MTGPMIRLARRLLKRPVRNEARAAEAHAFLATAPAPMAAVRPPEAGNDDPLRPLCAGVERELRVAGLIR